MVGNLDAWEVFQRYACPWGADSGAILALCRALGIENELETLEKVLTLLGAIESEQ